MTKLYGDTTFAKRSSWYDKSTNNAEIKAISVANRSNGQIAFNLGNNSFYRFDSTSIASDDGDTTLAPDAGSGRWLKITASGTGGSGNALIQEFDNQVSTFKTAESITLLDAVCNEIHNGSGSNEYKIFRCDADLGNRKSFAGFAMEAAAATPEIKTYTISAAYVSGNTIPININGRGYSTVFASSSDASLQALATLIATDQDVFSATVTVVGGNQTGTDDREIVITSKGSLQLNLTGTDVTSGASQPTITIATSQAAAQIAINIKQLGPQTGFSGLIAGDAYYLSGTTGAITNSAPLGEATYVGRAQSTTVLFVDPHGNLTRRWGSSQIYVRSHGTSDGGSAGAAQDSEHFNAAAWSIGVTDTGGARLKLFRGDVSYNGKHYAFNGLDTSGTVTTLARSYNKNAWSAETGPSGAVSASGTSAFNGFLYQNKGTNNAADAGVIATTAKFNGTSWSVPASWSGSQRESSSNVVSSLLYSVAGRGNGTNDSTTETRSTADSVGSATASTNTGSCTGANSPGGKGLTHGNVGGGNGAQAYEWNGTTWSSLIATSVTQMGGRANCAFYSNIAKHFTNGGQTVDTTTAILTSQSYNGTAFSSEVSSTNTRGAGLASVI